MKYIDKILNGREVVWRTLGEVCEVEKGKQLNKTLLSEVGKYPAYNGGVSYSGFTDKYNYTENKIIISQGGASAGFVNFITTKFYANAHCYVILPNTNIVDNRYIYHFLKLNQDKLMKSQHGAGIPALKTTEILGLLIPIPPRDVQEEIVEVLDKFTELERELEQELELRLKQYEYYRNKLLTFDDDKVQWRPLGEVADIARGASPRPIKNFITDDINGIPWIKIGDTLENYKYITKTNQRITEEGARKSKILSKGTLVISNSMSFGRPYILKIEGAIHDGWAYIDIKDRNTLLEDYLYYYLRSDVVKQYWISKINKSSVSNLNINIIKSLLIPIPARDEQERIVEILDKFDKLVNSLSEGLPREIELRRKQYEYYRNELLCFDADSNQ